MRVAVLLFSIIYFAACPEMTNIEITLEETQALISWEISDGVSHIIIHSCDIDNTVSPLCVNTTVHDPVSVNPAIVDIPEGATLYRFDFFLYDGTDLVMSYAESNGTQVVRPGTSFSRSYRKLSEAEI